MLHTRLPHARVRAQEVLRLHVRLDASVRQDADLSLGQGVIDVQSMLISWRLGMCHSSCTAYSGTEPVVSLKAATSASSRCPPPSPLSRQPTDLSHHVGHFEDRLLTGRASSCSRRHLGFRSLCKLGWRRHNGKNATKKIRGDIQTTCT